MKLIKPVLVFFLFIQTTYAQDIFGLWKTVDDEGISKSIVRIYKTENDKVEGKVFRILKESERDRKCTKCEGDKKDKPIEGLVILEDMVKDGNEYKGGQITDPEKGKTYDCKIWLDEDNPDILHVRGYIAFFYRTQDWIRADKSDL